MIAKNIKPEPLKDEVEEIKTPELGPGDMKVLMHILLKAVNGVKVPQTTFDEYDRENIEFSRKWDGVNKCWNFFVPQKRKRGIIKPPKKILLPGDVN